MEAPVPNTKTLQDILEEWHPKLRTRTGSPTRLMELRVYYDFNWRAVFRHNRAAFRHGQDLARRCGTAVLQEGSLACS